MSQINLTMFSPVVVRPASAGPAGQAADGGGCHGYQYGMAFESKMAEDDTVIEMGDVKVIMDSQSAPLLQGAEVDYVDSVQGSGFSIKNPQAKTTCGCGSSFSA